MLRKRKFYLSTLIALGSANASSHGSNELALDEISVLGRRENLIGVSISASEGVISNEELERHPINRSGDLLEYVPGLVATQHSGAGKANQYFLRGFNLDHATDFATTVEDMPINLRTHGHGQGYTDTNFLIPETIGELRYRKGPYAADQGDFASAGSAIFRLNDRATGSRIGVSAGEYGFLRAVAAGGEELNDSSTLSYGAELQRNDGPWRDIEEDLDKRAVSLKLRSDQDWGSVRATVMGYENEWSSADQIPARAVASGLIDRLGQLDTEVGGETSRYSLSLGFGRDLMRGLFDSSLYYIDYDLDLFSNFTYFLDDPINGDQFQQFDQRRVFGGALSQSFAGDGWRLRAGLQARTDLIDRVGLSRTRERQLLRAIRDDQVREGSVGIYLDGDYQLSEKLRAYAGARFDRYQFKVQGDCALLIAACFNSGRADAQTASPKISLAYTASEQFEHYLSFGEGFHSNDARGTTTTIDPNTGDRVNPVDALVDQRGAELGSRWFASDAFSASFALWQLRSDSELVFVGDAGTTEASRPSKRQGVELGVYYFANDHWNAEFEASYTRARFTDDDAAGDRIPGAIPLVLSAGLNGKLTDHVAASVHLRHFSAYPLIEDQSVESDGSTLVNARLSYQLDHWRLAADLINLLDSDDHDIDYFYASRLAGEPSNGIEDRHFRSFEPRTMKLSAVYQF